MTAHGASLAKKRASPRDRRVVKLPQRTVCTAEATNLARIATCFKSFAWHSTIRAKSLRAALCSRCSSFGKMQWRWRNSMHRGFGETTAATRSGTAGGQPTRSDANTALSSNPPRPLTSPPDHLRQRADSPRHDLIDRYDDLEQDQQDNHD